MQDYPTISKWLGKAKGFLVSAKQGSEVLDKAKEVNKEWNRYCL
jgi:hypothetical protein